MPKIPIASLRRLSCPSDSINKYLLLGEKNVETILSILHSQKFSLSGLKLLEFGCGTGMNTRHLARLQIELHATEYQDSSRLWCEQNIRNVRYTNSSLKSALDFPPNTFDVIFSSVFMNFSETHLLFWMQEFSRLIRPGGLLLVFIRSETECRSNLSKNLLQSYEKGNLVVVNEECSGRPECKACHPVSYVQNNFSKYLPVIDIVPSKIYRSDEANVLVHTIVVMKKLG